MTSPDRIPYRIRIGVTGHRTLPDAAPLAALVAEIIALRFREAFTPEGRCALDKATDTAIVFTVISPLAEGADRLVARTVLENGGRLEALLPLPRQEYEKDFSTPASRQEFADLLAKAHHVTVTEAGVAPDAADYRRQAYRRVGEETVARCDILIALWDGEPSRGPGGTAAIVAHALKQGKPVFILSTAAPGTVELKNGGFLGAQFLAELNAFNAFVMDKGELEAELASTWADLFPSPLADPLPAGLKEIVRERLLPCYCLASGIAMKNQRRYFATSYRAYIFSTLSVAGMAGTTVFGTQRTIALSGYIAELSLLIILYLMIHRAVHARVHWRWLEHRALAERLRVAFYFSACGEHPHDHLRGGSIHRRSRTWVDLAYGEILSGLPVLARLSYTDKAILANPGKIWKLHQGGLGRRATPLP